MAEGGAHSSTATSPITEEEVLAAATTRRLAAILPADVAGYSRLMLAESFKLKPDELVAHLLRGTAARKN